MRRVCVQSFKTSGVLQDQDDHGKYRQGHKKKNFTNEHISYRNTAKHQDVSRLTHHMMISTLVH